MTILDIVKLLDCEIISGDQNLILSITKVYAGDLMSDILTRPNPGALLLSGLVSSQVARTSKIANLGAIVFVRGKKPTKETKRLAEQYKIPLLVTKLSMFEACGILFSNNFESAFTKRV